jgi:hypothetical protein
LSLVRALRLRCSNLTLFIEQEIMAPTARPKTERRKKSTSPALSPDTANDSVRVSEADIAARAFAYYCERGCQDGAALDDWLRAERELLTPPRTTRRKTAAQ